jgi:hypothetical protein
VKASGVGGRGGVAIFQWPPVAADSPSAKNEALSRSFLHSEHFRNDIGA